MDLNRFYKSFSEMNLFLKSIGFPKKDNRTEERIYGRFLGFSDDLITIESRLTSEIKGNNDLYESVRTRRIPITGPLIWSTREYQRKLNIDLQDFYFYTRRFLDTPNLVMRRFFIRTGKKGSTMSSHSSDLINNKIEAYKKEIDFDFFDGLKAHTFLLRKIIDSRDGLMHHNDYLGFTKTKRGTLGFEIFGTSKTDFNMDNIKDVNEELQKTINDLCDLLD